MKGVNQKFVFVLYLVKKNIKIVLGSQQILPFYPRRHALADVKMNSRVSSQRRNCTSYLLRRKKKGGGGFLTRCISAHQHSVCAEFACWNFDSYGPQCKRSHLGLIGAADLPHFIIGV